MLCLSSMGIQAQPVIGQAQMPGAGDTSYLAADNLPSGIKVQGPGPNQRWDFTTLQAPYAQRLLWRPAQQGRLIQQFRGANLVSPLDGFTEGYFRKSNSDIRLVGTYGADPLGVCRQAYTVYSPHLIVRRTSMRYRDRHQQKFTAISLMAAKDLPGAFLRKLPLSPDSVRLHLTIDRREEADAWGKMIIPGGIFDVLREKQIETRQLRVSVKIGQRKWQDITSMIALHDFLPEPGQVTYHFYSNDAIEPIASIFLDGQERDVKKALFKAIDFNDVQTPGNLKPDIYGFPNPAIVNVRFEFANLPAGDYELAIFNLLGVPVWKERYFVSGNRTEKIDISELRKGTYLYSLKDDRGNIVATKRLVVIRP